MAAASCGLQPRRPTVAAIPPPEMTPLRPEVSAEALATPAGSTPGQQTSSLPVSPSGERLSLPYSYCRTELRTDRGSRAGVGRGRYSNLHSQLTSLAVAGGQVAASLGSYPRRLRRPPATRGASGASGTSSASCAGVPIALSGASRSIRDVPLRCLVSTLHRAPVTRGRQLVAPCHTTSSSRHTSPSARHTTSSSRHTASSSRLTAPSRRPVAAKCRSDRKGERRACRRDALLNAGRLID